MADKTIPAFKILRGNVGISTATPAVKLHVEGNDIRVNTEGSYQAKTLYFRYSSGAAINSDSYLTLGTGGSPAERMRVISDGNIGIATTIPGAKLDVNGSAIFRGAASWAGNDTQNASIYLSTAGYGLYGNFSNYARNLVKANSNYVEVGQNSTLVYGVKFIVGSNAANGFMFQSNISGSMTTHMSIRGDTGRVGIGTNAPGDVLHVDGNTIIGDTDRESIVLTLKAQNTAGAPAATTQIRMKGYEGRGIGTFYEDSSYSGQEWFCGMNYSAAFGTWNVGYDASGGQAEYNANTLFRVRYTGRVEMLNYGSGTFTGTPAYKLAVDSSGNIIETAVGAGQVDGSGTTNYVAKWTDGDTIGNSSIFDNGSVGIGTNSALNSAKLDVRGNVYSQGFQLSKGGSSIGASILLTNQAGDSSGNDITVTANHSTNSVVLRAAQKVEFWTYASSQYNLRVRVEQDGDAFFYGGNWYCNTNNSSNVSNGGLYINRGGGLYAYALATARSGTALGGVDFWDYHGVGLVFGPDSSTKVLTVKSNIGIGTTDPGYILDVRTAIQGAMQVKGAQTHGLLLGEAAYSTSALYTGLKTSYMTGTQDYMIISGTTTDGNTYISAKSGNNTHMRAGGNNSTNEIVVSASTGITYKSDVRHEFSTGNVGIGTSPGYKLEVKASVTGNWLSRIYNTATSGNSGGLLVRMDEPGSTGSALGVYANGGYKFKVEPDGEVQILSGSAYTTHLNYQNTGSHFISMANGGATYFRGSSNSITTMTVLGTGSVGIGGTPSAALDIFAANASSIGIRIVGGNKVQFLNASSNTNANIYNSGASGAAELAFQIAGATKVTINNSGNIGIGTTNPAATLDVKQGSSNTNNKLMKVADDVLSVYKVTGLSNHTVTLTCGSYFQAEVVITANQTNAGTYNNLYIRGIWSNNHYSHHWDEIENIGSLTGSSFSITVGQNDVSNSGKLTITHTYSSGSFSQMVVRVTDLYGVHSYSIT